MSVSVRCHLGCVSLVLWGPKATRRCGEFETCNDPTGRMGMVVVKGSTVRVLTSSQYLGRKGH